ncbi:MAG: glycosyltransferase family 4 protein [Pseudomonadota bacterium]
MSEKHVHLLYFTAEQWPTFRQDVVTLFGKYLPQHGIATDLVTERDADMIGKPEAPWDGGRTILCDVPQNQAARYLVKFWHNLWTLVTFDAHRYHAIVVRDMSNTALLGLIFARIKRLPFYYWMSYPMPEGQITRAKERGLSMGLMKFIFPWIRGHLGRFLLYKLVLPHADHVFVQSEKMKMDMLRYDIAAEKMTPVPMGVDMESIRLDSIPPANDPQLSGRRVLVYLGSLERPRRIEILFEMLAMVKAEEPTVLLALVGDTVNPVHRRWLQEAARNAGVEQDVLWTGWMPMREGWRYVRAAELGLSPIPRGSLLDCASPTKVPEYLALGLPVVCNDNPDQQAIIEKTGAGRCVPYTAPDFARAVIEILRLNDKERQAMAERGRDYVAANRDYRLLAADLAGVYMRLHSAGMTPLSVKSGARS